MQSLQLASCAQGGHQSYSPELRESLGPPGEEIGGHQVA